MVSKQRETLYRLAIGALVVALLLVTSVKARIPHIPQEVDAQRA